MSYAEDEGLDAYDPPDGSKQEDEWRHGYHTTREGKTLRLYEMTEDHLRNTITYFKELDTSPLLNELNRRKSPFTI